MLDGGKPIPAQFFAIGNDELEADFSVSLGPGEKRELVVEQGMGPEIKGGIQVEDRGESFLVRQGTMEYEVSKDLSGLLSAARGFGGEFVRGGAPGLRFNGRPIRIEGATVSKPGPLMCELRFAAERRQVVLRIPRTKSWVEVWFDSIDAGEIALDLNLVVAGRPALIDFGAGGVVYVALRQGQKARLEAAQGRWKLLLGEQLFARGAIGPLDGWAHVKDEHRATAVAVEGFSAEDTALEAGAGGGLRIVRSAARRLHFWLHFVKMPVEEGALTSPQSMMSPLRVVGR